MTEKLRTIAQTLRGIGMTEEGNLVDKAILQLGALALACERLKERAEAAEAEILKMKTATRPPARRVKAED